MTPIKHLLKSSILILSSIFILTGITGCGSDNKGKQETSSSDTPSTPTPSQPKKEIGIVLLHGLGYIKNGVSGLDDLRKKLQTTYPHAKVIAPVRDCSPSIEKQAEFTLKQIEKEGLADKELVIIGESQGGLVAAALGLFEASSKKLDIKKIITSCTPWEGVPLTQRQESDLTAFADNFANINLPDNPQDLRPTASARLKTILLQVLQKFNPSSAPGIKDMVPNSPFLQQIASKLPHAQVPILAIGGKNVEFQKGFIHLATALSFEQAIKQFLQSTGLPLDINQLQLTPLEAEWAALVGAPSNEHDLFIPLSSQAATNIRGGNPKFQSKTYDNYHHFTYPMGNAAVLNDIKAAIQEVLAN